MFISASLTLGQGEETSAILQHAHRNLPRLTFRPAAWFQR